MFPIFIDNFSTAPLKHIYVYILMGVTLTIFSIRNVTDTSGIYGAIYSRSRIRFVFDNTDRLVKN